MPKGQPENVTIEFVRQNPTILNIQPNAEYYQWGSLRIVESDDDQYDDSEDRWKHVSFSCRNRLPSWEEIKAVRMKFFPPEAEVIQVLPPVEEYVDNHPFTLHLWWCKTKRLTPKAMREAV